MDNLPIGQNVFERSLELVGDVRHGQGFNPYHAENPHHQIIADAGFEYSHTTRVGYPGGYYALHTYRLPGTDWVMSVNMRPGFRVDAGRIGSGRRTALFGSQVKRYAIRKAMEVR